MGNFKAPTQADLMNDNTFGNFLVPQQSYDTGPARTTAAMSGTTTYGATSFNVSDILQGAFAVKDSSDQLLVVNKALTQDLSGLYQTDVGSLSSFSSGAPAGALTGATDASGTGGTSAPGVSSGGGGTVEESYVMGLPKVHPVTKALLWRTTGKASSEMHIPVAATLAEDVKLHKQTPGMPPEWQHPWNMDRVGGVQGGGGGFHSKVSEGPTKMTGENANDPGNRAAFGYLSPEDEQYYISMAWPYKGDPIAAFQALGETEAANTAATVGQSGYKGKRILVYSVLTGKACVCTPGDWGPHPKNTLSDKPAFKDSIAGLSPDTHFYLGTTHGTEIRLGWMDDSTPVGPYGQYVPGTDPTIRPNPISGTPGAPGTIRATDFVNLANQQKGKIYSQLSVKVEDPDPKFFDCSNLVYWCAMRLGYKAPVGTPADWSYSQLIIDMIVGNNTQLTFEQCCNTPGAIFCRAPGFKGKATGHVAISMGNNGQTIEALSPALGIANKSAIGRDWTHYGYLPGTVFDSSNQIRI